MPVKIEFFYKGKSLDVFDCIERSCQDDRDKIAEENGIKDFDKMVLDDGRVIINKEDIPSFTDSKGHVWYVLTR
jgi:hypothetical protein